MPPLLPDYLSQPVQIVFKSVVEQPLQNTELWPVIIGAAATLGGAALGAWLGAKGAYQSTFQANTEALKREKLEEALHIVFRLVTQAKHIHCVLNDLPLGKHVNAGKDNRLVKAINELDDEALVRLNNLLRIYDSNIYQNTFDFFEQLLVSLVSIDKTGFDEEDKKRVLLEAASFEIKIKCIEQKLLEKLKA